MKEEKSQRFTWAVVNVSLCDEEGRVLCARYDSVILRDGLKPTRDPKKINTRVCRQVMRQVHIMLSRSEKRQIDWSKK